jgi:hypothetical protein
MWPTTIGELQEIPPGLSIMRAPRYLACYFCWQRSWWVAGYLHRGWPSVALSTRGWRWDPVVTGWFRLARPLAAVRPQIAVYGRSIAVTRESFESTARQQQATARARWKHRHRRDRLTRRIFEP